MDGNVFIHPSIHQPPNPHQPIQKSITHQLLLQVHNIKESFRNDLRKSQRFWMEMMIWKGDAFEWVIDADTLKQVVRNGDRWVD